ncbi:hypothetical protein [Chromobacterium phragmitis]|nr:hypothetical protein [Chromobacterium phragmitis]
MLDLKRGGKRKHQQLQQHRHDQQQPPLAVSRQRLQLFGDQPQ